LGWEKRFRFDRERVACHDSIDYRRSTMKIDRASAQTYARWFQALADANRVVICNLLADAGRPMTVGEIVEAVDIGQSTVSHHLKLLAEVGFVQAAPKGTARLYRFNQRCLEAFPTAAELVMGQLPRAQGVQCLPGGQAIQQRQQEIAG
jgi:ArsR family transcriptional regulator, arsenate/arsenite/antimonite-responsive transcriptional repressor